MLGLFEEYDDLRIGKSCGFHIRNSQNLRTNYPYPGVVGRRHVSVSVIIFDADMNGLGQCVDPKPCSTREYSDALYNYF